MKASDILVIGSGIAGLMYALEVPSHLRVTVLAKNDPLEGNTRYAQGGIASVTDAADNFQSHIDDTLRAGCGLCDEEIVRLTVTSGPASIHRLVRLGAEFQGLTNPEELGQEGGHSARRILHSKDATGQEIQRVIFQAAMNAPNITLLAHHVAIDLILRNQNQVVGVYALNVLEQRIETFGARVTMLAAGGAGKVYLYTSNPDVATGDGIAMAYRAGAVVRNMEFFQFHPTCLHHPKAKSFLISEAVRGEGGLLLNGSGERFMSRYDERLELAPRDIVARAIDTEMKKTGADFIFLDIRHLGAPFIQERFPFIYARAKEFGIDITSEPIPVVPAAHYCCGGVQTDRRGKTSLAGLYATGETASTGLHGANRLASNSLLEAIVFAQQAAEDTAETILNFPVPESLPEWDYLETRPSPEEVVVSHAWDEVRRLMWNLVGIVRSDKRLKLAERRLNLVHEEIRDYYWSFHPTADLIELRNIIEVARLIVLCASRRRESRGLHYNIDCPETDDARWKKDTVIVRPGWTGPSPFS